jgi:hypothetical protein
MLAQATADFKQEHPEADFGLYFDSESTSPPKEIVVSKETQGGCGLGVEARDPNGMPVNQPGAKLDADKIDLSLLLDFSLALQAVAEVAAFGHYVKGYARGGWLSVPEGRRRYLAAKLRHLFATEDIDKESGLIHEAHEAWNTLAKLEIRLRDEAQRK